MSGTVDLKSLARRVLERDTSRDSERDRVSHGAGTASGTVGQYQRLNPASVPSVPPVPGVPGVPPVPGVSPTMAYRATSVGPDGLGARVEIVELPAAARYKKAFGILQVRCPALIDPGRWRACVEDGNRFLAKWGSQAEALGWTSADLFGLHTPPERAGLNAKDSAALATKLQAEIDSGRTANYVRAWSSQQEMMPDEPCWLCEGTGTRKPAPECGAGDLATGTICNACHGKGYIEATLVGGLLPLFSQYRTDRG